MVTVTVPIQCEGCKAILDFDHFSLAEGILAEEARLTCPECGTTFLLKAVLAGPEVGEEPGEAPPKPLRPKTPAAKPPGAPVAPAAGGETIPAGAGKPPVESLEAYGCLGCGAKWLGERATCCACDSPDVEPLEETTDDLFQAAMDAVTERGEDPVAVARRLLGLPTESIAQGLCPTCLQPVLPGGWCTLCKRQYTPQQLQEAKAEAAGSWEGSLADFSAKMAALLDEVGMGGQELGDMIEGLQEAGALKLSPDSDAEVEVDLAALAKMLKPKPPPKPSKGEEDEDAGTDKTEDADIAAAEEELAAEIDAAAGEGPEGVGGGDGAPPPSSHVSLPSPSEVPLSEPSLSAPPGPMGPVGIPLEPAVDDDAIQRAIKLYFM